MSKENDACQNERADTLKAHVNAITCSTETADESTYQQDCARTWRRVFGKDMPVGSESELQAADLDKVPDFERKIRAQYADIFQEPAGLPPVREDGGFRIHTIPGTEPPHRSPYRLTPEE